MRVLKDRDGDLWVEVHNRPDCFVLPGDEGEIWTESESSIARAWGPLTEMKLVEA